MQPADIRNIIAQQFASQLPDVEVVPYFESMFYDTDTFRSYKAPAVLVVLESLDDNPQTNSPFESIISYAAVIVADVEGTASDSDLSGWKIASKLRKYLFGKTFSCPNMTSATNRRLVKQERLDKLGDPTGQYYWVLTWQHLFRDDDCI